MAPIRATRPIRFGLTLVAALAVSVGLGLGLGSVLSAGAPAAPANRPPVAAVTARLDTAAHGWSTVATPRDPTLLVHEHGKNVVLHAFTTGHAPIALLVRHVGPTRVSLWLPVRPNGATGWVRPADVILQRDPYRLVVHLATRRLDVFKAGRLVYTSPVAVGKPSTPTPTGLAYILYLLRQPDPAGFYGSYAYGLSFHSDQLAHFDGGSGEIGLHGTNDPSSIGNPVSHGCIRVPKRTLAWLVPRLPLGTPVRIKSR